MDLVLGRQAGRVDRDTWRAPADGDARNVKTRRPKSFGREVGFARSGIERAVADLDGQVRPLLRPVRDLRRFCRFRCFLWFQCFLRFSFLGRGLQDFGLFVLFPFRRNFNDAVQVLGVVAAVDLERLLSNEFLTLDRDVGQAFGVVDRERRRQAAVLDPGLAGARLALALQDFRSRGRLAPRQRRFLLFVASG